MIRSMRWRFRGRQLNPPIVIVRRVLAWAALQPLHAVTIAVICFGYGFDEARRYWSNRY